MLTLAAQTPGEPEIFASLQGEGASAGKPCAFVRLSRCNLACVWCDTAYTWRFEGDNRPHRDGIDFARKANQVTLAEDDVAARIAALGQPRLVITGGEPLLQAPALARMIAALPAMRIEVETNGTVAPPPAFDALVQQYNVSPKLAHSGNPAELALVPERLAAWAADPRALLQIRRRRTRRPQPGAGSAGRLRHSRRTHLADARRPRQRSRAHARALACRSVRGTRV